MSTWTEFEAYGHHQMLALIMQRKATGVWRVCDGRDRERSIFFAAGDVVFAKSYSARENLLYALFKLESLTPDQYEAVKPSLDGEKTLAHNLVQLGLASHDDVRRAACIQVEAGLTGALALQQGRIAFFSHLPQQHPVVPLASPQYLIRSVMALEDRDHLARHLGDAFQKVPVINDSLPENVCAALDLPPELVELAKRRYTIKDIAFDCFLDFFLVSKFFYALELLGYVTFESEPAQGQPNA